MLVSHGLEDELHPWIVDLQGLHQVLYCLGNFGSIRVHQTLSEPLLKIYLLDLTHCICVQRSFLRVRQHAVIEVQAQVEVSEGALQGLLKLPVRSHRLALACIACLAAEKYFGERLVDQQLVSDQKELLNAPQLHQQLKLIFNQRKHRFFEAETPLRVCLGHVLQGQQLNHTWPFESEKRVHVVEYHASLLDSQPILAFRGGLLLCCLRLRKGFNVIYEAL